MSFLPADDVGGACEAAARILHGLFPRTFAYAVERKADGWRLRVECATDDGWQAATLPVDPAELAKSLHDAGLRKRLTAAWMRRLVTCGTLDEHVDAQVGQPNLKERCKQ